MRVFEPRTLTVLPTNTCTAACRHCSMNASPHRTDRMTYEQIEAILTQVFAELDLLVVVFSGGEATLLGEDLERAIAFCKAHGVVTRLVTNGHWATSEAVALDRLRRLRAAGLDELNISTDDYHLPFVSLQRVRTAFNAALTLDFAAVVITNCFGPESSLTPERLSREFGGGEMKLRYDADGKTVDHDRRSGQTLVVLSNSNVQQLGVGVTRIADSEVEPRPDLDALAQAVGGCPWAVRSAAISAKGHLVSCCGFEVEGNELLDYGDLGDRPLRELLDRADDDLITNMIATIGPPNLRRLLEQLAPDEVDFSRPTYRSYCEVCHDLIHIKKNRDALYRYQGEFVETVMQVREWYAERFTQPDGTVKIPPGVRAPFQFEIRGLSSVAIQQAVEDGEGAR